MDWGMGGVEDKEGGQVSEELKEERESEGERELIHEYQSYSASVSPSAITQAGCHPDGQT